MTTILLRTNGVASERRSDSALTLEQEGLFGAIHLPVQAPTYLATPTTLNSAVLRTLENRALWPDELGEDYQYSRYHLLISTYQRYL
jgi:hypothetical protein